MDLELFSKAYDVPAEHRLVPFVDTVAPPCERAQPVRCAADLLLAPAVRPKGRSCSAKSDLRLPRRPCPAPPAFPLYRPPQTIRPVRALIGGHALTIINRICSLLSALPVLPASGPVHARNRGAQSSDASA
ncbi:hypothetical protein Sm713_68910 [Streptomyces sp. TS71-3]|nr:hypothetical protein Sm713_68910 [Streptomyces sp. TS71-3]